MARAMLPTPTAKANMLSPSMQKWPAHRNLWPTPNASPVTFDGPNCSGDGRSKPNKLGWAVQMWPTPTARLGDQRGAQAKRYSDPARSNDLDDAVAASGTIGQLSPTWVEWLMGFPTGWTDLEDSATP